jgi:hypothetical protein
MTLYDHLKGITNVKISVNSQPNQDLAVILITMYGKDENGDDIQFYVKSFEWQKYQGFDLLDIGNVSFPGWVQVRVSGTHTHIPET